MACIATIGYFDGVHLGHRYLVHQLLQAGVSYHLPTLLITFDRHPREVFAPDGVPLLLTTAEEKLQLLRATGVDGVEVLPFDAAMASLTASEFMERVLLGCYQVKMLLMGYDHHFGRPTPSCCCFDDYRVIGQRLGIAVLQAHELQGGGHISSSAIRRLLLRGDIALATAWMGRAYEWTGEVVHGRGIGRRLGFPTANLVAADPRKLLPGKGVYAVLAGGRGGMLNIGTRPTLGAGDEVSVEVHIFHCHEDLYGQCLTISFLARLRDEQTFPSEYSLRQQLERDLSAAATIIRNFKNKHT